MSGTSKASATRKMRIAQVAGLCMVALAAGAVMFKPGLPERPTLTDPNTIEDGQDTQANAKPKSRYDCSSPRRTSRS